MKKEAGKKNTIQNSINKKGIEHRISSYLPFKLCKLLVANKTGFKISRILPITKSLFMKGFLLNGKEANSLEELRVIIFTNDETTINYFSDLIFEKQVSIRKIGFFNLWNFEKKISKEIDFVILNVDEFFASFLQKKGYFVIPSTVSMILDVSETIEILHKNFKKGLRERINKIRNNGISWEITKDEQKFNFFYYKMYLPYAIKRYEDKSIIFSYNVVKSFFEKGEVLLVMDDEKYVSGMLLHELDKKTLITSFIGIYEGKFEYLKKNAGIAATYYSVLWAKENGYKYVNFGHCKPFIKDGVLQHNLQWNADVIEHDKKRFYGSWNHFTYGFKNISGNIASKTFLKNNPFITIKDNSLKEIVVLYDKHDKVTPDDNIDYSFKIKKRISYKKEETRIIELEKVNIAE